MRRLLFLALASALAFVIGGVGPAQADNGPHVSTAQPAGVTGINVVMNGGGRCAGCHRAHTAQGSYLLVEEGTQLCETCHNGSMGATTDVLHGVSTVAGALRGGGFQTAAIDTAHATKDTYLNGTRISGRNQMIPVTTPVAVTSTHTVDVAGTMWGNGAIGSGVGQSVTLECTSCHDPHGNGNFRILRPIPTASGAGTGVKIPDEVAKTYTTANYWLSGDSTSPYDPAGTPTTGTAQPPNGFIQNIAAWCTTCHTRYLAGSGSYQTNSGDSTFMFRHRSDRNDRVAGGANCITCHVAHGSPANMTGNAAQVAVPGGAAGSADSSLLRADNRGICLLCHNI